MCVCACVSAHYLMHHEAISSLFASIVCCLTDPAQGLRTVAKLANAFTFAYAVVVYGKLSLLHKTPFYVTYSLVVNLAVFHSENDRFIACYSVKIISVEDVYSIV